MIPWKTFHIDYPKLVDKYISSVDAKTIQYAGREWTVYDGGNVFCMTKAARYRLPEQIMEFMQGGDIIKLHGGKLTVGLKMTEWHNTTLLGNGMMGGYDDDCYNCGVGDLGYSRYTNENGGMLCELCARDAEGYTHSHITDTNLLDWVHFMSEDYCNYRYWYYVNCNPDSDRYGSIICDHCIDDFYVSNPKFICNADSIVSKIYEWIRVTPSQSEHGIEQDVILELNPLHYVQECDKFLDSEYVVRLRYRLPKQLTRRYILEHADDVNGNSEFAVIGCVDYLKYLQETGRCYISGGRSLRGMTDEQIVEYAWKKVTKHPNDKVFESCMIDRIHERLYKYWLYAHLQHRSFGAWICNQS